MKAIAFIFARGGSKGLPGKNILPFLGKPLIAWSIEHALSVDRIERVIVSTDSEEIASIAREYGAEVPFIRPEALAQDDSPEILSWQHALNYLYETSGSYPGVMISLPPTAPLRLPEDIDRCLNLYEDGGCDVVITMTASRHSPYFNMVRLNGDGLASLVIPGKTGFYRRQDVPVVYDMTTVCYVASPQFVAKHNSIFEGRVRAVTIPTERASDIDSLLDFQFAEFLMRFRDQIR